MAESVERYFRMLPVGRRARPGARVWRPDADVYRTADGWIVKVDLAGVSAEELEIVVQGRTLSIRGCRRDTFFGTGVVYHQLEITYSRFEKKLLFPCSIEGASVLRDYRDGLLILHLRGEEDCEEGQEETESGNQK
ncbi:MAG TPA: Hsp20/alpha crystallin family protein [Pyrinomonadaceae bacterium]|nr:Hsp20/alpha crystallin family protein [Pyrinomonadaceae bacterium]